MDTTSNAYMYAGVQMVWIHRDWLLVIVAALLQVYALVRVAWGPLRRYQEGKALALGRRPVNVQVLDPPMQDKARGVWWTLVVGLVGVGLLLLTYWLDKK